MRRRSRVARNVAIGIGVSRGSDYYSQQVEPSFIHYWLWGVMFFALLMALIIVTDVDPVKKTKNIFNTLISAACLLIRNIITASMRTAVSLITGGKHSA